MPVASPAPERFAAKVNRRGPLLRPDLGRCWEWTAARHKQTGYGIFHPVHGQTMTAHRYAYEREHGRLAPGMVPDHLCRNRGCVRPSHLEAVTNAENVRRGLVYRLRNGMDDSCRHGHKYTPENTYRNPNRESDIRCRECARIRDRKRNADGRRNTGHRRGQSNG